MIVVANRFENRLDKAWHRLQNAIQAESSSALSQVLLDLATIEKLEEITREIEANNKAITG
jgi:hypothetical protein